MPKEEQKVFLIDKIQKEIINELTDEEAGKIFKAIFEYETTKEIPKLEKTLKIVFTQFKIKLDFYEESYNKKCLKNKENIKKYWEKKKEQEEDTNEYDRIRTNTNVYKIKEKEKEKEKEKTNINIIKKESIKKKVFKKPTIEEINKYCEERNNGINAEAFYDFYESKNWYVGKNKMSDWKACVRTWEKREDKKESKYKTAEEKRQEIYAKFLEEGDE